MTGARRPSPSRPARLPSPAPRAAGARCAAAALLAETLVTATLVTTTLVTVTCGGPDAAYRWPAGSAADLEIRMREEIVPGRLAREVRITAQGGVGDGGAIDLRIESVRHETLREGRTASIVDTTDVSASPTGRTAADAALARVADAMVGRRFRLNFDPQTGLNDVSGLGAALAPDAAVAGDAASEDARAGLRLLLADEHVRWRLRAAGLCEIVDAVRTRRGNAERAAELFVPGAGLFSFRIFGAAGAEADGSPVLRLSGKLAANAVPSGPAGVAPPEELGPVVLSRIEVDAETLYDRDSEVPLRGRATVRLPYRAGVTVATTASFVLVVHP